MKHLLATGALLLLLPVISLAQELPGITTTSSDEAAMQRYQQPTGPMPMDRLQSGGPFQRDPQPQPPQEEQETPEDEALRSVEVGPETPFGAYLFQGRFAQSGFQGFNPDYTVGVGDRINVLLWGAVEATQQLVVDSRGNIFLPTIGPVNVMNVRNGDINELVQRRVRATYEEDVGVYAALATADPIRVFVGGGVEAPGLYPASASVSILHLIDRAGGIDAESGSYLDIRVRRGGEIIQRVNLYRFLLEGELPALQLRDGDTVFVGPRRASASVGGLVQRPARYEFEEAIALNELLRYASAHSRATHVEIVRNQTPRKEAEVLPLNADLSRVHVVAGDELVVFEDRRIGAITASVRGEFEGVSRFVLPQHATLADLLSRVELTERSNLGGISLFRESVAERQREVLDRMLRKLEEAVLSARSGTREEAQLRVQEAELIKEFIDRASKTEPRGQVILHEGFDPSKIALEHGDVIEIPRVKQTVAVQGEVFVPTSLVHQPGKSVDFYLEQAGGLTQPGDADKVFVRRANGAMELARGGLFSRTRVEPGDEIMVLPSVQLKSFQFTKDLTQVISQVALTAGVVLGI
ncbi:polysaccharide biosynthesis/export family protein [Algiphilus sp.]|uniref:polysaccharide biosynthesis/export family protein n=1 Tax=Algiphilus sp. TaxID=1872431 RepID=UPI003B521DD3